MQPPRPSLIVALGSSFAAGPGLPPLTSPSAGRSSLNYASLFALRFPEARLLDLSVSGATLLNLLSEAQVVESGEVFPPQLDSVPADADVVTITAGGNDLGYIGAIVSDELRYHYPELLDVLGDDSARASATKEQTEQRFLSLVDRVHQRAPHARILLVEYLRVFGPRTEGGRTVRMPQHLVERHARVGQQLVEVFANTARRRPFVERVEIDRISKDHALGDKDVWVFGFDNESWSRGAPFHPNYRGMEMVAEEVYRVYSQGSQRRAA